MSVSGPPKSLPPYTAVPQGSTLSPLLLFVLIHVGYSEDGSNRTLFLRGRHIWWKIGVNAEKRCALFLAQRRKQLGPETSEILDRSDKYLDIIIDKKLLWKIHNRRPSQYPGSSSQVLPKSERSRQALIHNVGNYYEEEPRTDKWAQKIVLQ